MAASMVLGLLKGIETRLATISGLRVAHYVPDQVNPPQAVIEIPPIANYHGTFAHGRFLLDVSVMILTSKAYDRAGQELLAGFLDPTGSSSIHATVEADRTLGGAVDDCIVSQFRPLSNEDVGSIGYYGGVFTLHVIARGS